MPQITLAASTESYPISFNGETGKLTAFIKNDTAYLPLRDIIGLCFVEINWDNVNKQANVNTGLDSTVFSLKNGVWYINGQEMSGGRTPLIYNNQLYLPLYVMTELCEVKAYWYSGDKQIEVSFPVVYTNGQWQYSDGTAIELLEQADGKDVCCTVLRQGEPTMGCDYLWALYANGEYRRLTSEWNIADWQIRDGVCYYLAKQMGFGDKFRVYAVDLTDGTKKQLGNPEYVYHITIKKAGSMFGLSNNGNQSKDWQVTDEGVLINGISEAALSDEVVADEELMRQTYGRYLLPLDGGEQTMLEALSE